MDIKKEAQMADEAIEKLKEAVYAKSKPEITKEEYLAIISLYKRAKELKDMAEFVIKGISYAKRGY